MNGLQITTEKLSFNDPIQGQQNITAISLQGILDSTNADELNEVFLDNLFTQHIYKFIVDLSQLDHIGSAGIGVFIGVLDILQSNKGTIAFVQVSPKIKTIFDLFRLSTFYKITNDRAAALKELQTLSK